MFDPVILIADILKVSIIFFILLNAGGLLTWVERKQAAVIQHRIGANRALLLLSTKVERFGALNGPLNLILPILAPPINFLLRPLGKLGLFHALADGGKMLFKEDFMPTGAHPFLFQLAPFLAVVPAFMVACVIPFGPDIEVMGRTIPLQIASLDMGILFFFAFGGIAVYSAAIGGWASGNKFALLGSIRASAQMISYEVAYGLAIVGTMMVFGTVRLDEMVVQQGELLFGFLPAWGVVMQPLGFLLFYTALLAEGKRVPFDLPEGESEIVAGYFTEYSGMKFGTFFMAEFIEVFIGAAMISVLFFGGWQVPYLYETGFVFPWGGTFNMPTFMVVVTQVGAMFAKILFFCWLNVQIRWTLLRFRFDQLIRLGWKFMLPAALANIFITGLVMVLMDS